MITNPPTPEEDTAHAGPDTGWIARAVRIDDFRVDTMFLVSTRIQFCDEVTGHIIPGNTVLLPTPDLPLMMPDWIALSLLAGREQELVGHYRRVVAAFTSHGRLGQLRPGSPQFWLKPVIVANGSVLTDCSWYDTVPEAETFLQGLIAAADAPDGDVLDDMDQGWRVRVVRSGSSTCIAEWDWEQEESAPSGYAFDSARLAVHARAALVQLRALHRHLTEAMDRDWWSYTWSRCP